jgi:hypothetical protein
MAKGSFMHTCIPSAFVRGGLWGYDSLAVAVVAAQRVLTKWSYSASINPHPGFDVDDYNELFPHISLTHRPLIA